MRRRISPPRAESQGSDATPAPLPLPRDPVDDALEQASRPDSDAPEDRIARAILAFPGARGALLGAFDLSGALVPLGAAGLDPPDDLEATRADRRGGEAGEVRTARIPSYENFPEGLLAVRTDRSLAPPDLDRALAQFARRVAPVLAAAAGAREWGAAQARLADRERELERTRAALLRDARHGILGRLLTGIAAELADPLAVLVGISRTLREESDPPRRAELQGDLEEAAERARSLFEHLASLANEDPEGSVWCPFSLDPTLRETLALAQPVLTASGIEVEISLDQDLPPIEGSEELVRQAFLNVVGAIVEDESRPEGKAVLGVEAREVSGRVVVRFGLSESPRSTTPPSRWPTSAVARVGWWVAQAILRDHGARTAFRNWPEGPPHLTIAFPPAGGTPARAPLHEVQEAAAGRTERETPRAAQPALRS